MCKLRSKRAEDAGRHQEINDRLSLFNDWMVQLGKKQAFKGMRNQFLSAQAGAMRAFKDHEDVDQLAEVRKRLESHPGAKDTVPASEFFQGKVYTIRSMGGAPVTYGYLLDFPFQYIFDARRGLGQQDMAQMEQDAQRQKSDELDRIQQKGDRRLDDLLKDNPNLNPDFFKRDAKMVIEDPRAREYDLILGRILEDAPGRGPGSALGR